MSTLVITTKPLRVDFAQYFDFEFDVVSLVSDPNMKKVLKRDVELDEKIVDDYDWVILVGSEPFKLFTKKTSVTEYSGKIVNEKFLGCINPSMITFKPEVKPVWESTVKSINGFVSGAKKQGTYDTGNFLGITNEQEAFDYILDIYASDCKYVGLDSETTALYPRDGHLLGISISNKPHHGAYIHADVLSDRVVDLLQKIIFSKEVVFHNAKFDVGFFKFHLGLEIPFYHDTMLLHYAIDERPGTHGLKQLALKYTEYGDYEEALHTYINTYCKEHGYLKSEFTWDLIPFEIMYPYAAIDSCVTLMLFSKLQAAVEANPRLKRLYYEVLLPASRFLGDVQDNGVPMDMDRLRFAQKEMDKEISEATEKLYSYPEVRRFVEENGEFNPNSVMQLRKLLFDNLKLSPTGIKTGQGNDSTNAEALEILAAEHEIPNLILTIRKMGKIKNTYLDKIIPNLTWNGRLYTNFNIHSTTSGRLSSSGKLNMQQLPRDNPAVKGCIKARDGYKIVSIDLQTAEMYIAAVLANDKELQSVFTSGGNFHSTIAKKVFNLPCPVEDVAELFASQRQAAKAVSFGILYGASAKKISETVTKDSGTYFSLSEAQQTIEEYFGTFKNLKKWLDAEARNIETKGFLYSFFNRKRRLRNVNSSDRGVKNHEIRSGLNFLIQSTASDVTLLGGIEMNEYLKKGTLDAKIFALVHDSILAEVREDHVDAYVTKLLECIQRDRGVSIEGSPIKCDLEIGDDYSFGKFEKVFNNTDDQ